MNLLDILKEDGFTMTKVTDNEFAGACPWCQGKDRFIVWPGKGRGGKYWCRKCNQRGDTIDYLTEHRKLPYREALKLIASEGKPGAIPGDDNSNGNRAADSSSEQGIENLETSTGSIELSNVSNTPNGSSPSLPCDQWQSKAGEYLLKAQKYLWQPSAKLALDWLHDRGLADETIKRAGLGACRVEQYETRKAWGLAGKGKKVWLPAGMIIPSFFAGRVCRLRIRRLDPGEPRYVMIGGSYTGPMVLNPDRAAAVIVESELDALLVDQEAGDLVTSIGLGSVSIRPDSVTHEALEKAEMILLALDADEAGAVQARDYWLPRYAKAKRWPVIKGKDPAEAHKNGLNLRAWVLAGIFGSTAEWERWCIENEAATGGDDSFPCPAG